MNPSTPPTIVDGASRDGTIRESTRVAMFKDQIKGINRRMLSQEEELTLQSKCRHTIPRGPCWCDSKRLRDRGNDRRKRGRKINAGTAVDVSSDLNLSQWCESQPGDCSKRQRLCDCGRCDREPFRGHGECFGKVPRECHERHEQADGARGRIYRLRPCSTGQRQVVDVDILMLLQSSYSVCKAFDNFP